MGETFGGDDELRAVDAQLDRDHEREGGYGSYLPYQRRPASRRPIQAAGVLQPMLPQRIVTRHDGEKRCDCTACCKLDPSRIGGSK